MFTQEKPGSPAEMLEHFGVKGMHWGERKARETSGQKSKQPKKISPRKERRAKTHEGNAARAQQEIDRIRAKPSKIFLVQNARNNQIKELEKFKAREEKAARDIRAGHMTDFQKKAIVGGTAVAVVLAAYGTYKLVDSGTAHQMLTRGTPFKTNDLLSRKMAPESIMKEVVAPINPKYGEVGTKMNCRRATFAFEMRRRGMDVKATNTISGTGQTPVSLLNAIHPKYDYKTGKYATLANLAKEQGEGPVSEIMNIGRGMGREPIGSWGTGINNGIEKSKSIFSALAEHPEGARGELGMTWRAGGAHSMAWEMIGGKAHIFDAQSGKHFVEGSEEFRQIAINMRDASATRLDNLPLNSDYLRRWVRNV